MRPNKKRYWSTKDEQWWAAACYWTLFAAGWNDGQTGPLLLRIQANYHLTYTIVSLIFVFAFCGFVTGCLSNVWLTDRLGLGKVIAVAASCQIVAYAIQSSAPPFPVFCLSFVIAGNGMSLQDAQANTPVATLDLVDNRSTKMSILHAAYGFGAFCSPLVATKFAELPHWNYHYLVSMTVAVINVCVLLLVFRLRTADVLLCRHLADAEVREKGSTSATLQPGGHNEQNTTRSPVDKMPISSGTKLRMILLSPIVQLLALYSLLLVSVEITIGSWIVPYAQTSLHAPPSSGMIASGYWAGLIIVALEIVIWQVPSIIGTGVVVAFVGVFLGPLYILLMHACSHTLPGNLFGGAIGYIVCLGQAGSAIFPFLMGALSQKDGVWVLQPLIIAILLSSLFLWFGVMRVSRKHDGIHRDDQED